MKLGARVFQRLPIFPGRMRLGRWLFQSSLVDTDVWVVDREGHRFHVPSLREPVGYHLFLDGSYEKNVIAFLKRAMRSGGVFVDIGANVGALTVPVSTGSNADRVLALEASPSIFGYLTENISENRCVKAAARCIAVTERNSKRIPFYEAPVDHFGMGSRAPQFSAEPIYVEGRCLDDVLAEEGIPRVAAIKIDVEGYEAAVFQGAAELLQSSYAPLIVFEFCDWAETRTTEYQVGDAQRVLLDWGYSLRQLFTWGLEEKTLTEPMLTGYCTLVAHKGHLPS